MNCGLYKIESPSGKSYIGSSVNIRRRLLTHISTLRTGKHHNINLQRACDKYGIDNLRFNTLLYCNEKELLFYEQLVIDSLQPAYNCCKFVMGSPMAGRKHSKESMLKSSRTRILNGTSIKHGLIMKGRGHKSTPEINHKIRIAQSHKILCVETNNLFQTTYDAVEWLRSLGKALSKNSRSNLHMNAKGKLKSAYGYTWKKL